MLTTPDDRMAAYQAGWRVGFQDGLRAYPEIVRGMDDLKAGRFKPWAVVKKALGLEGEIGEAG